MSLSLYHGNTMFLDMYNGQFVGGFGHYPCCYNVVFMFILIILWLLDIYCDNIMFLGMSCFNTTFFGHVLWYYVVFIFILMILWFLDVYQGNAMLLCTCTMLVPWLFA